MKASTNPANDTLFDPSDYTDGARYEDDKVKAEALAADTARCFAWADSLIERGVIAEGQRTDAERALIAMLSAGTSSGPSADRARDLVRRMMIVASKPTPLQEGTEQRRMALVRVLRVRQWAPNTLRSLRRIDPAFRAVTREIYERDMVPGEHEFAARLAVATGAWGDRDLERSVEAFRAASRNQSRRPRKR